MALAIEGGTLLYRREVRMRWCLQPDHLRQGSGLPLRRRASPPTPAQITQQKLSRALEFAGAMSNVRDQRRRAVGAPLADRKLSAAEHVLASGVTTRADPCIA
jgi:hypothetical protein